MSQPVAHFNTAGAGIQHKDTAEAVRTYLDVEMAIGPYEAEQSHSDILESQIYRNIGALLAADSDDIALFDSATRAWLTPLSQITLDDGAVIWTTPYEYAGNLIFLFGLRERFGAKIEVIPTLANGDLDLAWMRRNFSSKVALVSVVYVPSGCGIVNPVYEIGEIVARENCIYAVDACQAVGQLPIDVTQMKCHLLSAAGRKFLCGPRGTGFAYISKALRQRSTPSFVDLHKAEFEGPDTYRIDGKTAQIFEFAERNNAGIVGLNSAVSKRLLNIRDDKDALMYGVLCKEIMTMNTYQMISPGSTHSGIATIIHLDVDAELVGKKLRGIGINCWVIHGSHTPIFMNEIGVKRAIRISIKDNTDQELNGLLNILSIIS